MAGGESAGLPTRRFSDEEVTAILRRASVGEVASDLPSPYAPTLNDLVAAAAEVGLDPGEVRRAAAVVPAEGRSVVDLAFGASDRRTCTARLEGTSLPGARQHLVRAAESHLGYKGQVVESDRDRFLWQETHLGGRTSVSVAAIGGATEIEVRTDRAGHYLGLWFGGLLGWAGLSALSPVSLPLLPAVLAFLLAPPLLARPFWIRADKRLRARMEVLVMALARAVEEGGPTAPHGGNGGAEPAG
ncbi:MAG TPA: hypothetical protein VLA36_16040 [Longimicrobiales bacterium]|nr:hypothetical protein [Longimicrobiales bacterium]